MFFWIFFCPLKVKQFLKLFFFVNLAWIFFLLVFDKWWTISARTVTKTKTEKEFFSGLFFGDKTWMWKMKDERRVQLKLELFKSSSCFELSSPSSCVVLLQKVLHFISLYLLLNVFFYYFFSYKYWENRHYSVKYFLLLFFLIHFLSIFLPSA